MKKTPFSILTLISLLILQGTAAAGAQQNALPIPPVLEGPEVDLYIGQGELELPFGTSKTLGFNGNYLGPTLRMRRGDFADITVENSLSEDTTVHWHGMHVPAEFDGGPHQVIPAGSTWNPRYRIDQQAATLWYHPHLMGKTAEHVYRGLAGLFIIDDDYSDSLAIPKRYGENDIPLILQDRRFNEDGTFSYRPFMPDIMMGYIGNAILVNGAYEPVLKINRGTYRFRVLNGSNSSVLRISFSDKRGFTVIASDGGFLPESVETDRLVLSPGERYEILADFDSPGTSELITEIYGGPSFRAMKIEVTPERGVFFAHPEKFKYAAINPSQAGADGTRPRERIFNMETRGMGGFTINGKQMDLQRIDFTLPKNNTEVWTIRNVGMGMMNILHSFHVHDVQFSVLSVNGGPPPPLYRGPKDTVLLLPGDEIKIALRFEDYNGIYMYHCHFLEHEDSGMMGQFRVE